MSVHMTTHITTMRTDLHYLYFHGNSCFDLMAATVLGLVNKIVACSFNSGGTLTSSLHLLTIECSVRYNTPRVDKKSLRLKLDRYYKQGKDQIQCPARVYVL